MGHMAIVHMSINSLPIPKPLSHNPPSVCGLFLIYSIFLFAYFVDERLWVSAACLCMLWNTFSDFQLSVTKSPSMSGWERSKNLILSICMEINTILTS